MGKKGSRRIPLRGGKVRQPAVRGLLFNEKKRFAGRVLPMQPKKKPPQVKLGHKRNQGAKTEKIKTRVVLIGQSSGNKPRGS